MERLSTNERATSPHSVTDEYYAYYALIRQEKYDGHLISWYFDFLREKFSKIGDTFWGHFPESSSTMKDGWDAQSNVFQAVAKAYDVYFANEIWN